MQNTIITCAGMRRSGSTWLFNAIRGILTVKNHKFQSFFLSPNIATPNKDGVQIIKLHHFSEEIKNSSKYVFTTVRDIRDIAASAVRRKTLSNNDFVYRNYNGSDWGTLENFLEEETKFYYDWKTYSNFEINYKCILYERVDLLVKISNILQLKLTLSEIDNVLEFMNSLKLPEKGVCQDSQLWHNHITDGGICTFRNILSKEIIKNIEKKYPELIKNEIKI